MNLLMKIYKKVKERFTEEEMEYPKFEHVIVRLTDTAKENFINDENNMIIVKIVNGKEEKPIDFSWEELRALREVEQIPILFEDLETKKYVFENEENFGEVMNRR